MSLINELWKDESGLILSAETVTLGTVGVLGSIVGLNALGTAVNDEMKELASAFRSLDQSYGYVGHRGCRAWSAGSCYIQPDVQQSLAEINADGAVDVKAIQQQVEEQRKAYLKPAPQPTPHVDPTPAANNPAPAPNDLPKAEAKPETEATTVPAKQ